MLKFLKERNTDYDANYFINELAEASKSLGILEAKINAYKFNSILIPLLHRKERPLFTVPRFLWNQIIYCPEHDVKRLWLGFH